jgi:hypothetical protein
MGDVRLYRLLNSPDSFHSVANIDSNDVDGNAANYIDVTDDDDAGIEMHPYVVPYDRLEGYEERLACIGIYLSIICLSI